MARTNADHDPLGDARRGSRGGPSGLLDVAPDPLGHADKRQLAKLQEVRSLEEPFHGLLRDFGQVDLAITKT